MAGHGDRPGDPAVARCSPGSDPGGAGGPQWQGLDQSRCRPGPARPGQRPVPALESGFGGRRHPAGVDQLDRAGRRRQPVAGCARRRPAAPRCRQRAGAGLPGAGHSRPGHVRGRARWPALDHGRGGPAALGSGTAALPHPGRDGRHAGAGLRLRRRPAGLAASPDRSGGLGPGRGRGVAAQPAGGAGRRHPGHRGHRPGGGPSSSRLAGDPARPVPGRGRQRRGAPEGAPVRRARRPAQPGVRRPQPGPGCRWRAGGRDRRRIAAAAGHRDARSGTAAAAAGGGHDARAAPGRRGRPARCRRLPAAAGRPRPAGGRAPAGLRRSGLQPLPLPRGWPGERVVRAAGARRPGVLAVAAGPLSPAGAGRRRGGPAVVADAGDRLRSAAAVVA